jgi:transcriptional regulator of acetoin/glycerol metabolism
MIVEKSGDISACSLVFDLRQGQAHAAGAGRETPRRDFSLEAAEREFIVRALKETGWQRTRAAALLGITRATLHAKLKRYDIKTPTAPQPLVQDFTELRVDDVTSPG